MNIVETLSNLLQQTAFFHLTPGNYLMILVALVFLYLGIAKGFEPLLMVPIAFGMLLVNIYPDIMLSPEKSINGTGGLLWYFFRLDEWTILPSLIFLGVGAQTDFSPLIANPISFLLGAAAQFGIYAAYFIAIFLGFTERRLRQFPSSEERTVLPPSSFATSWDRRRCLDLLRLRHTAICLWFLSSSLLLCGL